MPPNSLRPDSSGRTRRTQRLVALERDIEVTLKSRDLGNLHPDGAAWRKLDWPGKIAKGSTTVRPAKSSDIEDRFALKFAAATFVEQRVFKDDLVRRCGHGLE